MFTCILCHESGQESSKASSSSSSSDCLVIAAHIQVCTVLNQNTGDVSENRGKPSHDHLPPALDCGPIVTSCGHVMHASCYQDKMDKLVEKENDTFRQT